MAILHLGPADLAFLDRRMKREREKIEEHLGRLLRQSKSTGSRIESAYAYTVRAGGKRLRPILMVAASKALGERSEISYRLSLSLELIHSYSLIHDDLPEMDDDDMRRGKPTCHKVFGEGIAMIAGVALIGLAVRHIIRSTRRHRSGMELAKLLSGELLAASGVGGLIGGQAADILAEARKVDGKTVDYIHRHKTASLFGASTAMGAMLAGAPRMRIDAFRRYGLHVGFAFQIVDDILDETGSFEALGKRVNKDAARGKATYPALHGFEGSRRKARWHARRAERILLGTGVDDRFLRLFPFWILLPASSPGGSAR